MIATIFRCELRSGRVLKPLPIIMFLWFHWDICYLLYFYYASFCCAFQQKSCPTIILYNSVSPVYKFLFSINLVQLICYQLYIAVFLAIQLYFFSDEFITNLEQSYQAIIMLIWAFTIGNILSNTDLVTIKNTLLKLWAYTTVFISCLCLVHMFLQYLDSYRLYVVLISIVTWCIMTYQQKKMKFPLFNIKR